MLNRIVLEGKDKDKLLEEYNTDNYFIDITEVKGTLFKGKKYEIVLINRNEIEDYIIKYIDEIGKSLNINIKIQITNNDKTYNINLNSESSSLLIGKEGRTLNSIQLLLHQSIYNLTDLNLKIYVDAEDYKKNKLNNLEKQVKHIIKDVINTKVDAKLDPMNSYERRLVHTISSEYTNIVTESFGEEPKRYVTIKYKED